MYINPEQRDLNSYINEIFQMQLSQDKQQNSIFSLEVKHKIIRPLTVPAMKLFERHLYEFHNVNPHAF